MGPLRTRRRILILASITAVVAAGAAVLAWSAWAQRGADLTYDTSVREPALAKRRPRVLFDHGHNNTHSISGRFAPFANLLRADGCEVASISSPITPALLAGRDVLVTVNASGPEGRRDSSAFADTEIAAIKEWVSTGGSLLLVADHHPYGPAAAALARAFSVQMVGGWCDDEANVLAGTADSGAIVFERVKGMLGEHSILSGRGPDEAVAAVATFTGQSLIAPEGAAPLLKCADTAVDRVPTASKSVTAGDTTTTTFETRDTSAAGHCQGLAMPFGEGRLVVLGEAAMLSAQIDAKSGLKFGMNVPGLDNRRFVLNTMRWLTGELD